MSTQDEIQGLIDENERRGLLLTRLCVKWGVDDFNGLLEVTVSYQDKEARERIAYQARQISALRRYLNNYSLTLESETCYRNLVPLSDRNLAALELKHSHIVSDVRAEMKRREND